MWSSHLLPVVWVWHAGGPCEACRRSWQIEHQINSLISCDLDIPLISTIFLYLPFHGLVTRTYASVGSRHTSLSRWCRFRVQVRRHLTLFNQSLAKLCFQTWHFWLQQSVKLENHAISAQKPWDLWAARRRDVRRRLQFTITKTRQDNSQSYKT